eukprot:TRINITY_DN37432_c0_g1_i1.p1 TRINITY_DN37432_c0_g1~~TRINITY_DN37432_c0_g1_i1.p1  ORF type:complete len:274 (+),score=79.97 TRINITY_DN37432_c0_g1_i1:64-885(+)
METANKRKKRIEQRLQEKERERLRAENEALRDRVEMIAETGEEHRMKVEEMFVNTKREQEELEAEFARLENEKVLLCKEIAESGGQLSVSQVEKLEMESTCLNLEKELLASTTELSDLTAQLTMADAEAFRLAAASSLRKQDVISAEGQVAKLTKAFSEEQALYKQEKADLLQAQGIFQETSSQAAQLREAADAAHNNYTETTHAVTHLMSFLEEVHTDANAICDAAMPALIANKTPLPKDRHIPEEEARQKREAKRRADAMKRSRSRSKSPL